MRFLIDKSPKDVRRRIKSPIVRGQLLTPLTGYSLSKYEFGIDNGAYSGFDEVKFERLIRKRQQDAIRCLFVACRDVVGSHEQTLEMWKQHKHKIPSVYRKAFVLQNGSEDKEINEECDAFFVGGMDPWKDSKAVVDLVREIKRRDKFVHVGRVNTPERFITFMDAGADTCDGNGVGRYDHMLHKIEVAIGLEPTNFDSECNKRYLL